MNTIIIDDDPAMLDLFRNESNSILDLNIIKEFTNPISAYNYAIDSNVDLICTDIHMPKMDGIKLAKELKRIKPDILIVFITAFSHYLSDFNLIGGDYYILKPYTTAVLQTMMDKIRILNSKKESRIYIQMFGRFQVLKNGNPIPIVGKSKEILAYLTAKRGYAVSNDELYSTIWENDWPSHDNMKTYFNAISRLKKVLEKNGLDDLIIKVPHGYSINKSMVDCDYYSYLDSNGNSKGLFINDFLCEYTWAEYLKRDLFIL